VLDLNVPVRSVAGVDLAADAAEPRAFYVLPPPPRVAVDGGEAQVELLRFVRNGTLTGGHLRLAVELAHPPAALAAAADALAAERHGETVELRPLPVEAAEAEVLFVGRETTADGGLSGLTRRGFGRTAAGFAAPYAAAFAIELEPDGVRLIEAALRSGGAPVGVIYRLRVEGLWPALRVVARVDWGRVYDQLSSELKEGSLFSVDDVQKLAERLVESRVIQIQVVQGLAPEDGKPDPALSAAPALAWIQRELVERFCEPVMPLDREPAHASLGTVGEIFGVGASFAAKKLTQIERATAEIDFQQSLVVGRTLTAESHLADLLAGDSGAGGIDAHIADAGLDHPFFARFALDVGVAQPFAGVGVKEVVASVAYGSARDALDLTAAHPAGHFESWTDASPDRTWTLQPDVTFADDAPLDPGQRVTLPPLSGQGRAFTLDLERLLGLVRFDVEGTADPRVMLTRAALTARRGDEPRAEREVVLTPAAPRQTVWFRDFQPGDRVEAATRHLLADGRSVDSPPMAIDSRVVRLPPPFPGSLTVQLYADDDWTDLETVVVALQKQADGPSGTFRFDGPGKAAAISLDMPDPTDHTFRYKVARTWSSGAVEEDDWVTTDLPVVLVGRTAANKLIVDVTPVGPELPEAGILLIEVELSYIDAENQVRDEKTAVLRARADRFRWEVAIHDPQRRAYQYRTTVHRTSGATQVGPWTTATDRILAIPITKG